MAGPHPLPDVAVIADVRLLYLSPLMQQIRDAHREARPTLVWIGKYSIQYEPLPFSGMTAFPHGFVVGKEAFTSEDEFKKTLLQEVYRLCHSEIGRGGDAHKSSIRAERDAAFYFAERSYHLV